MGGGGFFDFLMIFFFFWGGGGERTFKLQYFGGDPGVMDSSHTGSYGFFRGGVLVKTLRSPNLVLVKPRKDMDNVSCRCDMTEILLKGV